ncbi:MAG TPA: archaeosortase/exosortase family protein, partial [Terriglobales bacterium]|nr:archaeosortase/exosortase family protein [Terriglobales bacterium]
TERSYIRFAQLLPLLHLGPLATMNAPIFRFAALFFLFLFGFSVLTVVTSLQNHLGRLENAIAAMATWIAAVVGSAATRIDGRFIAVPGARLEINHECTGVFVLFVLTSFIAAYPAGWSAKLKGLLVGILGLSLINVVRIATLVRLAEFYPSAFQYFHEYVWQGAFLMLVTLYAISWVEWARR